MDAGEASNVEQRRGERRTGVPRRDDRIRLSVADRADGAHERRVRLPPHGLGGLLAHADHLGAGDELEALVIEAGGPEEHGRKRLGRGGNGTGHDLVRCVVAAEGVDRDTNRHVRSR